MANIIGTNGNNTLRGTPGADRIEGRGGNDTINGLGGADALYGGIGNDTVRGAAGNDQLFGDAGADNMDGGAGADILRGGLNDDILYGQGGDRLYSDGGNDTFRIGDCGDLQAKGWGGVENDSFGVGDGARGQFFGEAGLDTFYVSRSADTALSGGADRDTFWIDGAPDAPSNTTITDYQTGTDRMLIENPDQGVVNDLFMQEFDDNGDGFLTRADGVTGTSGDGNMLEIGAYQFTPGGLHLETQGAEITLVGVESFNFGDWN